jgi:hypothetical protein
MVKLDTAEILHDVEAIQHQVEMREGYHIESILVQLRLDPESFVPPGFLETLSGYSPEELTKVLQPGDLELLKSHYAAG